MKDRCGLAITRPLDGSNHTPKASRSSANLTRSVECSRCRLFAYSSIEHMGPTDQRRRTPDSVWHGVEFIRVGRGLESSRAPLPHRRFQDSIELAF